MAGFEVVSWFGIMAPAGTAREVIAKLNADIVKALESVEVKDIITKQGGEVMGRRPVVGAACAGGGASGAPRVNPRPEAVA